MPRSRGVPQEICTTRDGARRSVPIHTGEIEPAPDLRRTTELTDLHERLDRAERRAEKAEQRCGDYERALSTRSEIDQVKGMLMLAFGLGPEAAFDVLVWISQRSNTKLHDVCGDILVGTHNLDVPESLRDTLTTVLHRLLPRR